MSDTPRFTALAIAAHPDDIELMMAGTLLRLREAGGEIYLWNLCNGYCGSAVHTREEIVAIRWEEAQASARLAGASIFPPLADDLALFYEHRYLERIAAVVREVKPRIILTHSPDDYMEDHQNASRLAVSGAFVHGMNPFVTDPPTAPWSGDCAIYHALPHGLRDPLRRRVRAGQYVDITPVLALKREMLARHRSQLQWLDVSQGIDADMTLEGSSRAVGEMSGRFQYAEGWRRHLHLGFSAREIDPLAEILGDACRVDPEYERELEADVPDRKMARAA